MADLIPRTRSEKFLNGEDLEPITRREHFFAGRESELPEGHQEPETREEWFIQKYREAGDVTVESLSITENGTYTAPSGKAYSPVSVNVPLPENAYLLKSIENVNIATFADGTDNFVKSLEVAIEPVQSGSEEPSPSNIRPISGWSAVDVTVADDLENPTVSNVYTIDLDGTRYGGTLDVVSGVLTVDRIKTSMPANWTVNTESSTYWLITNTRSDAISVENTDTSIRAISDGFKGISANEMLTKMTTTDNINSIALISSKRLFLKVAKADYPTLQDLYSMIQTNNIQVVYELATPQTIQLSPTIIKSLQGENNLFASTGEIELLQYWGR